MGDRSLRGNALRGRGRVIHQGASAARVAGQPLTFRGPHEPSNFVLLGSTELGGTPQCCGRC